MTPCSKHGVMLGIRLDQGCAMCEHEKCLAEIAALEERCRNLQLQRSNELDECQIELASTMDSRLNERLSYLLRVEEQANRIAELDAELQLSKLKIEGLQRTLNLDRSVLQSGIEAKDTELERLRTEAIIRITDLFDRHERPTYTSKSAADSDLALILTSFREAEEALKEP